MGRSEYVGRDCARAGRRPGLGVRLSWAPLYVAALALVSGADRKRAWTAATVASATWAFPFVAWIGPAKLGGLFAEHFGGHAAHWGGTAWTEPGPVRALWLARDILVDGFGLESGALGLVTTAVFAIAAGQALRAWRAAGWLGWRVCLGLAVPYLIWIGLGQNLRDQPRHALPLVALLAAGLALPAAGSRRAFAVVGALAWMVSLRTALDAYERRQSLRPASARRRGHRRSTRRSVPRFEGCSGARHIRRHAPRL